MKTPMERKQAVEGGMPIISLASSCSLITFLSRPLVTPPSCQSVTLTSAPRETHTLPCVIHKLLFGVRKEKSYVLLRSRIHGTSALGEGGKGRRVTRIITQQHKLSYPLRYTLTKKSNLPLNKWRRYLKLASWT